MGKTSTKPPSGMRDFLPEDLARRKHVIGIVERIYRAHGFVPLETPTMENLAALTGKYGDEGDQLLYRVLRRRDALRRRLDAAVEEGRAATESELADLGLRYDLTVPFARVVAEYGDLPRFFKRYQIQPVWRADRPGKGRFREFYQCDVDITGTASLLAEAEVCSAVATVLREIGFTDFEIRVNHRELLRAAIRAAGIEPALESTALVAVDKLDKIGRDGVIAELGERGIAAEAGTTLLSLLEAHGTDALAPLREKVDDAGREAIDALSELLEICAANPAGEHLRFYPALARGLSYYTGPIFEIAVHDLAGSLGGGGRYDDLVGMFGKQRIPAVGFSLGLERIIVVMEERGMYPELPTGPEVLLCSLGIPLADVSRVATALRVQGLRVEVYPEQPKLKKQLQYASSAGGGAEFAAIVGEVELRDGAVTLKHLASGEQRTTALADVGEVVAALRAG